MTLQIRNATPDDADTIAQLHVDTWQAGYRGLLADEFLDTLSVASREMQWNEILKDPPPRSQVFVAEDGDDIVGFASCGACEDEDLYQFDVGEIQAVYISPDRWREGIGTELLREAVAFLKGQNFDFMSLWVLESNRQARDFYEKAGFIPDGTEQTEERNGYILEQVRYRAMLP